MGQPQVQGQARVVGRILTRPWGACKEVGRGGTRPYRNRHARYWLAGAAIFLWPTIHLKTSFTSSPVLMWPSTRLMSTGATL